jgi:fumarate hydratase class I
MLALGQPLPVDFRNRVIYYVGPSIQVRRSRRPTTATRMETHSHMLSQTA